MNSSKIYSYIYSQFRKPTGLMGNIAGWIMAFRKSNIKRIKWTVDLLDIQPNDNVLEIGFGPGLAIKAVAEKLDSGKIIGIDHSEVMTRHAIALNNRLISLGKVQLYTSDYKKKNNFTEKFDIIFSINVLQFENNRFESLGIMKDYLKTDGKLAITYQPRQKGATIDDTYKFTSEIKSYLQQLNFHSISDQILQLKKIPAVCVLAKK